MSTTDASEPARRATVDNGPNTALAARDFADSAPASGRIDRRQRPEYGGFSAARGAPAGPPARGISEAATVDNGPNTAGAARRPWPPRSDRADVGRRGQGRP